MFHSCSEISVTFPFQTQAHVCSLVGCVGRGLPSFPPSSLPFAMSGNFGPGLIPKLLPEKCSFVKFKDSGAFFAAATLAIKFEL